MATDDIVRALTLATGDGSLRAGQQPEQSR
jgi:hypothetical protein